jgi:hypothetical protein
LVRSTRRADRRGAAQTPRAGIEIGPGTGKFLTRIRHVHIARHYAPLIAAKSYRAVKLDIVLRIIALSPEHAHARAPGYVLWDWHYEHLHDLVKGAPERRAQASRSDRESRHLKRKWIADQLSKLQSLSLVEVTPRPGSRSQLVMLRDDGTGSPFDDPGEAGGRDDDRYVTIRGSLAASGVLASWNAPELAAFLAALYAESLNERGAGRAPGADGTKSWWRQLAWFSDEHQHPLGRVTLPFSKSLLEDGLRAHRDSGLITTTTLAAHPTSHKPFNSPRVHYHDHFDHFDRFDPNVKRVAPEIYEREVRSADPPAP